MLFTVEDVLLVPGLTNTATLPPGWLYRLVGGVDKAVKTYCKRDLEYDCYEEYHSGTNGPDVILDQHPVWVYAGTIAPASVGAVLPQATVFLTSVKGLPPGVNTSADVNRTPPTLALQTGTSTWAAVTYTGLQANPPAVTGCAGGTGTLFVPPASSNPQGANAFTPLVYYDPTGYNGQRPGAFAANQLVLMGTQFEVAVDKVRRGQWVSERGTVRKIGGGGLQGFLPWWQPESQYSGKLAAQRRPGWPRGDRNVKVLYTAGYDPRPGQPFSVPLDLRMACVTLAADVIRTQPSGGNLSSESLGAYSYSRLINGDNPELADVRRQLAPYRETTWTGSD